MCTGTNLLYLLTGISLSVKVTVTTLIGVRKGMVISTLVRVSEITHHEVVFVLEAPPVSVIAPEIFACVRDMRVSETAYLTN